MSTEEQDQVGKELVTVVIQRGGTWIHILESGHEKKEYSFV